MNLQVVSLCCILFLPFCAQKLAGLLWHALLTPQGGFRKPKTLKPKPKTLKPKPKNSKPSYKKNPKSKTQDSNTKNPKLWP